MPIGPHRPTQDTLQDDAQFVGYLREMKRTGRVHPEVVRVNILSHGYGWMSVGLPKDSNIEDVKYAAECVHQIAVSRMQLSLTSLDDPQPGPTLLEDAMKLDAYAGQEIYVFMNLTRPANKRVRRRGGSSSA